MLRNFDKFFISDGILFRKTRNADFKNNQIVLPYSCRKKVFEFLHSDLGHPGREKTLGIIQDRFYWFGMTRDVENFVKSCSRCVLRKASTEKAPLVNITTSQPLELLCIDFLTLESSKGGFQNVLVVTDHFTKYAQAFPTKNQTAKTTADVLFHKFITHYGIPQKIHSDQGAQFEGSLIKELCTIMNIKKSRTTPYHPMGNGLCEKFNRTLLQMLGTLDIDKKADWKSHIGPLVHAYNSMKQESTQFSPFFLMFGRQPRLPVDIAFNIPRSTTDTSIPKYIETLKSNLKQAYKLASAANQKAQQRQKQNYDLKARSAILQPGDRVLVKITSFDGKHKLADKWESQPYIVVEQPNVTIPVYTVKEEDSDRTKTIHRNLLLPIGHLDFNPSLPTKPVPKPRKQRPRAAKRKNRPENDNKEKFSSKDSDDDIYTFISPKSSQRIPVEVEGYTNPSDTQDVQADDGQHPAGCTTSEGERSDTGEDALPLADDKCQPDPLPINEPEDHSDGIENNSTDTEETTVKSLEIPKDHFPSRPTRKKIKPKWMNSGEYVMSIQNNPDPDWILRCNYLRSLIAGKQINGLDDKQLSSAFLEILLHK